MKIKLVFGIILLFFSCNESEVYTTNIEENNKIPLDVIKVKNVEYFSIYDLNSQLNELEKSTQENTDIYYNYYRLKANFLEHYNLETLTNYTSIYDDLKSTKLYKLMAEIDILATFFYHEKGNYDQANMHIKRSFEYCFNSNMFLERQALIYGISPTATANTPEEKKEEIQIILKEIEKYDWSFYHSRIYFNLALANFYLKDYKEAERVLHILIRKNLEHNFTFELPIPYRLMGAVREQLTGDYKEYIVYNKKAIEACEKYGIKYLVLSFTRMMGHKYFTNNKFAEAKEAYKKAIEHISRDSVSLSYDYAYYGWAHYKNNAKDYKKSLQYIDTALTYTKEGTTSSRIGLERKMWILGDFNETKKVKELELKVANALNTLMKESNDEKYDEFKLNTILSLKTKNYILGTLKNANSSQEKEIAKQRTIIGLFLISVLFLSSLIYFFRKKSLFLKKIEEKNTTIQSKNKELKLRQNELILNEKELKRSLEKVEELNELKSNFLSMAAHQFRTPLTSILSSNNLIKRYTKLKDEKNTNKHITRISSSASELVSLLDDLLSIGKIDEGRLFANLDEFNIAVLGQEVVSIMDPLLKKDQVLHYSTTGENEEVVLDKRLIKHILLNLLSNAIKYSDEGKTIDYTIELHPETIKIIVKDQGRGIAKQDQEKLFTRFFRASNVKDLQGTGLGLNIVKSYVELMEGTITFESTENIGTTFIVLLPRTIGLTNNKTEIEHVFGTST